MLKFEVYRDGQLDPTFVLRNAYLLGADNVGLRATLQRDGATIACDKRAAGPAALSLMFDVGRIGTFSLQTCLLPEREEPYLLSLELARHRLMLVLAKQEDWLMFDLSADHSVTVRANLARKRFVEALNRADDPAEADRLARQSLEAAVDASEELALAHAETMISRRRRAGHLQRGVFGCGVGANHTAEAVRGALQNNFDYVVLPTPWRQLEPEEQVYDWALHDGWAEWARLARVPLLAGPVISLDHRDAPSWLTVMEHDYETVRDILYEHVERVVSRYKNVVTVWNVASGLHTNALLNLTLDQIMDLTRMAVMVTKRVHPSAKVLIEITHPFGEYYAMHQRSIPPLVYADMILQAGIPVEAFGVKLPMGRAANGQYTRDLMQISDLLDRYSNLGKPVHVTGLGVPSERVPRAIDAGRGVRSGPGSPLEPPDDEAGCWRQPWSVNVQSHWLEAAYTVVLSKPFVDSVAWLDLIDGDSTPLPKAGLANEQFKAKMAYQRLISMRRQFQKQEAARGARGNGR